MSSLLARRNTSRYLAARIESVLSTSRGGYQLFIDVWKQSLSARTFSNQASGSSSQSTPSLAQLATNEELTEIVNQFPPSISYAFGYGSGVLRQQPTANGVKANPGMVDIILATDNPYEWHTRNLQCHSDHYSLMARIFGAQFVTWLQVNFGAKLYFHPFVDVEFELDGDVNADNKHAQSSIQRVKREIKYGVVSTDDLISDLRNWDYLYLAGRMHKPIVSIEMPQRFRKAKETDGQIGAAERRDEIEDAQRANLLSAVSASLLLHGTSNNQQSLSDTLQSIPVGQLYTTIAGLSYTGDIRMQTGAEDPNKVQKLVETPGMSNLWDDMYAETLGKLQSMG